MNKHSISATFDEEAPVTQEDLDAGHLVLRQRDSDGRVLPLEENVTLALDRGVVEYYKRSAGEGYKQLMYETLKASAEQASLENILRKVIREELQASRSAG